LPHASTTDAPNSKKDGGKLRPVYGSRSREKKRLKNKIIHFKQLSGKISLFSIFYESKFITLSFHNVPIVNFDDVMLIHFHGKERIGKERKLKERKGKGSGIVLFDRPRYCKFIHCYLF
jgi:hypothetical protein